MTLVYTKPAVRDAWADQAVPTTDIVDPGNAYVAAGWLQNTVPPPRQYFNWLLNYSASGVRYFMQRGIVDYDAAELYQTGAYVQSGGIIYVSIANTNTGNTPASSPSYWSVLPYALLASPTFTGTPAAPTAAANTQTTQLATTAFANGTNGGLSTNSWEKLPSGRINIWGTMTAQATFTPTVTMSRSFPNQCFGVQAMPLTGGLGSGNASIISCENLPAASATTFTLVMSIQSFAVAWWAYGY